MSPRGDRRSRRHHYFPTFHLRYFADRDGAVWVHDRAGELSPNPKPLMPEAIAKEDELYTYRESGESDKSDEIERWLRDSIDAPASRALTSLVTGEPPREDEKLVLARYLASRDLRTPRVRDFILSLTQAGIDSHMHAATEDVSSYRKDLRESLGSEIDTFSDEAIREYLRSFEIEVRKEFWLDFLTNNLEKAALRLVAAGWRALHFRDSFAIASDLGILKHRGDFSRAAPHLPGWWNGAAGWIVPFTPSLALMLAPRLTPGDSVAMPVFTDRLNRDLAEQAHRFVFSHRPEPWVLEQWGIEPSSPSETAPLPSSS